MHGLILTNLLVYLRDRGIPTANSVGYDGERVYDDREFALLIDDAAERLDDSREQLLHGFGRYLGLVTFPRIAPDFYSRHPTFQSCLLAVEYQIHDVIRVALPGARPPQLRVSPLGSDGVAIAYTSERRVCSLLEGLVAATAEKYGTEIEIEQPICAHRGDPWCTLIVQAEPAP